MSVHASPPWDAAPAPAVQRQPVASTGVAQPAAPRTLRESFEAYFAESRRARGRVRQPTFERLPDGTYADDHTQRHWWTWQQAAGAMREVCAQVCDRRARANDGTGNRASTFGVRVNSGLQMAVRASEDRACAQDIRALEVGADG